MTLAIGHRPPAIGQRASATEIRIEWIAFAVFLSLTITLAANHVMWRDEVRALSVAIHSTSWSDLWSNLHSEGHPILWYAILRLGYGVTHSVHVMPVLSIVFASAAAYLILRFAPFPIWARLMIVFGAFLGYEFSVVARNYGIAILLMMVACILFSRRHERPILLGLTLAVMANSSVHAAFAALVIAFVWAMDVFNASYRSSLLRPASIGGIAIVIVGVVVAIVSANPAPGMAFAPDIGSIDWGVLLRKVLRDPGASLVGSSHADVGAVGSLPWVRLGINPDIASRIFVDVALLWLAWSLRKNRACLAGMIIAVLGFSVLFRGAYTGALRHEGVLFFLFVSLCWIASEQGESSTPTRRRAIALGMLPLLVTQTLALPVLARRIFVLPESSSKSFAEFIDRTPRYHDAILMSEPDYNFETMPYYVGNPVYMPRQHEFNYRVYFDRVKRQQHFTLGDLIHAADSVTCAKGQPALVAIAYPKVFKDSAGVAHLSYQGAEFVWNQADKTNLFTRGRRVASFERSADENYEVFEIAPRSGAECMTAPRS